MPRRYDSEDPWNDDREPYDDPEDPEPPGYDDDEEPTFPCPYCRREILEDSGRCPYCERYVSRADAPAAR